jgi:membrane protein implicated in regulation of membrane protease activity
MGISWWMWIVFGIVTLSTEILTPGGFYLMFVGASAIVVGAVAPFIKVEWIEILLFAVLSIFCIAVLRKPLAKRIAQSTPKADVQEFVGEIARAVDAIAPGASGAIELRGSTWQARNDGTVLLDKNSQCTVISRDGLSFVVKPK